MYADQKRLWCLAMALTWAMQVHGFMIPTNRMPTTSHQNKNFHHVAPMTSNCIDRNVLVTRLSLSNGDDDIVNKKLGTFHQDIISKLGFSRPKIRKGLKALHNKNDKKNDVDENDESSKLSIAEKMKMMQQNFTDKVVSFMPLPLVQMTTKVADKLASAFPKVKVAFLSFVAGAIVMLSVILIPVYSTVETLAEPVTLFETILNDLEQGYVDPVDTNKLFETGISAMLRSLDPYTEFEGKQEAQMLNEGIMGKYGGVGLVISGASSKDYEMLPIKPVSNAAPTTGGDSKLLPKDAVMDNEALDSTSSNNVVGAEDDGDDDDDVILDGMDRQKRAERRKALQRIQERGVRVVSAFEGYAFDYGLRVGDKIVSVDNKPITPDVTVDGVRNMLRGEPGTFVTISFEREGVAGVQSVTMPRTVVQLRDVKVATLVGNPKDGIGYIQLSGFASNAGYEVRNAILALERAAEDASNSDHALKGLILDLRGNPGGLLTSAVDVASLLVPNGSDIVSAKGRGFPGVLYRSRVEPLLDSNTKLAVLVNKNTASAAEIVSGAVQDLDAGIIVGSGRTFGKGLVQNVEDLPFDTALKFTVAKYYTPSGRCIQGINYKEGGGLGEGDGKYTAERVKDKDRQVFYTKSGRVVRDGGGVEADFKVAAPKASALEITLLRSDVLGDFAAKWSATHEITNNFKVDDDTYRDFQEFVKEKQKAGEIKLEGLYAGPLADLKRALSESGYKGSMKEVEQLQNDIIKEIQRDFDKYKEDIKEDIANSILARYVPESMLLERSLKTDKQVEAAVKLLKNRNEFETLLAKGSSQPGTLQEGSSVKVASSQLKSNREAGRLTVDF